MRVSTSISWICATIATGFSSFTSFCGSRSVVFRWEADGPVGAEGVEEDGVEEEGEDAEGEVDMEERAEERSGEERGDEAERRMLERMIVRDGEEGLGVEEEKGSTGVSYFILRML
jgi:hypothetical protein